MFVTLAAANIENAVAVSDTPKLDQQRCQPLAPTTHTANPQTASVPDVAAA
jgi:hypothetical protein